MGFFRGDGAYLKYGQPPGKALLDDECWKFIKSSISDTWAICGHTRQSTRGVINTDNAHPFRYGGITGSHNGILQNAPYTYVVDSQYAFDQLSRHDPGDYQHALEPIDGWFALTWHDVRDGKIYMLNWHCDIAFNRVNGVVYYSSDKEHLHLATGKKAEVVLQSGDVWCFDGRKAKELTKFKGKDRVKPSNTSNVLGYYQGDDDYHPRGRRRHNYSGQYATWIDGCNMATPEGRKQYLDKFTGEFRVSVDGKTVWASKKGAANYEVELPSEVLHEFFLQAQTTAYLEGIEKRLKDSSQDGKTSHYQKSKMEEAMALAAELAKEALEIEEAAKDKAIAAEVVTPSQLKQQELLKDDEKPSEENSRWLETYHNALGLGHTKEQAMEMADRVDSAVNWGGFGV